MRILNLAGMLAAATLLAGCSATAASSGHVAMGVAVSEAVCEQLLAREPERTDGLADGCRLLLQLAPLAEPIPTPAPG